MPARLTPALAALALAAGPHAALAMHPNAAVTDDPFAHDHEHLQFGDSGSITSVLPFSGGPPPAGRPARTLTLLGSLRGAPTELDRSVFADVAAYRKLAFVGKWREDCPGTGVDIIDISDPRNPRKLADTADHPNTSMEDMSAVRIGQRDVLVIGLQDCRNAGQPPGASGLELVDITDPSAPQTIAFFDVDQFGDPAGNPADPIGVHELDVTRIPGGRTLALLSVPDLEALSSDEVGRDGVGDLLVVDISDPTSPTLVAEWGVLGEPALGLNFYLNVRRGGDARTLLHSVRSSKDGTRAYLSYWDAGLILLDLADPVAPVFLGAQQVEIGTEGNAHSVDELRGGDIVILAEEDLSPFEFQFTSSAFPGTRLAVEASFTPPIVNLPSRAMAGEVVHVGRGCPADPALGLTVADPYLADPAGRIALVERGLCRFDNKIARALLAGATGVIVFNNAGGGDGLVTMGGEDPTTLPGGTAVPITIPAVFVGHGTGLLLREAAPPVTARAAAVFNGWGFLRFLDVRDPASPVQIGTFATAHTNDEAVATAGTFAVHNPEVHGNEVYVSWYSDGIRVLDVSRPDAPREVASWTGQGAPADAPPVNIWSVVPHEGLLVASDRNFGLYILKRSPGSGPR